MTLNSEQITDENAARFAAALASNHTITALNLGCSVDRGKNSIGASGMTAIADALVQNTTVLEVVFEDVDTSSGATRSRQRIQWAQQVHSF